MPRNAHRRHPIDTGGPWGTGLLLLGVASVLIGIGSLIGHRGAADALQELWPSLQFYAGLWVVAGAWSVLRALTPPQHPRNTWPVVGMSILWGGTYGGRWLAFGLTRGQWDRTWSGALVWFLLAGLILSWGRCINPPRRR